MELSLFAHQTIADFLRVRFELRYERNKSYSYRAYARDLGISRSQLSEVLKGKCGITERSGKAIASGLQLSQDEFRYFFALNERQFSRSKIKRDVAENVISGFKGTALPDPVDHDLFATVADWYHFAILELSTLKDFELSHSWIAKKLGISEREATLAIDRLLKTGLAKIEDGRLVRSTAVAVGNKAGTEAIREFHRQVIEKASASIQGQSVEQRFLSSYFVSVREEDLPRAKEKLRLFLDEFADEFDQTSNRDRLYSLSLQFFDLIQMPKEAPHA